MATQLIMDRWPNLQRNVPELFDVQPGSIDMLYIGANRNRHHYMPEFYGLGYRITLLEVWEPYLKGMEHKEMVFRAVLGDVRDAATLSLGKRMFDVVFFWHGPEHLPHEDLEDTLFSLERISRSLVVLGCPWGKYPQGAVNGNPYEVHASQLTPADFQKYGYSVDTLGTRDVIDSNVLAWKVLPRRVRRRSGDKAAWLSNLGLT